MPSRRTDLVSVIVLDNGDPRETESTVASVQRCDWPAATLEILVVSRGDATNAHRVTPGANIRTVSAQPAGTHPIALGAKVSKGQFLAIVEAGSRPHRDWIRAAVKALHGGLEIGAVASRLVGHEEQTGAAPQGGPTWFDARFGTPAIGDGEKARDVLFGSRNGLVLRAKALADSGGFDPLLVDAYDDVDLGWRLNLYGYRVLYCPQAIIESGAAPCRVSADSITERNALVCLYKNLEETNVGKFLTGALSLATRRATADSGLRAKEVSDSANPYQKRVRSDALSALLGADEFVRLLDVLAPVRRMVQAQRSVRDDVLFRLISGDVRDEALTADLQSTVSSIANAFNISTSNGRVRALVVTGDVIGPKMAGPAIRAWNMSEQLSLRNEVRLVSTARPTRASTRFDVLHAPDDRAMAEHEAWADVIVVQGYVLRQFPSLARTQKVLVADIYDPLHLEQLEQSRDAHFEGWNNHIVHASEVLNEQIARADFLLCASEKQRDFWLGQLAAVGRVNAMTYDSDNALRALIDVAPFGLDPVVPEQQHHAIKGRVPGIGEDDQVLLWGGGIYDWFDTDTLLRAMAKVSVSHPNARLFFLGAAHPNPGVPMMRAQVRTFELADELNLTDKVVFFNKEWVAFDERHNFLLDADAAVSTHFEHIETAFSFRTRILDYLWARLPIVATRGDGFAGMIDGAPLGVTVPERDVDALAEAIVRVLYDEEFRITAREQIDSAREQFAWSHALEPLTSFCAAPRAAPDRDRTRYGSWVRMPDPAADAIRGRYHGFRKYARLGTLYLRREGVSGFVRRARFRLGM